MKEVGKRLKVLRESLGLSQVKTYEAFGSTQSSINRYESGQSTPPVALLRRYVNYFDVSMIISLPVGTSHRRSHTHLGQKLPRNGKRCAVSSKCVLTPSLPCMKS